MQYLVDVEIAAPSGYGISSGASLKIRNVSKPLGSVAYVFMCRVQMKID